MYSANRRENWGSSRLSVALMGLGQKEAGEQEGSLVLPCDED